MSETARISLLNRTVQNLREAWRDMAGRTSEIFSTSPSPGLPDREVELIRAQLRDCLKARGGEVSARSRAASLGREYLSLNDRGRKRFLQILARDFDVDRAAVNQAIAALQGAGTDSQQRSAAELALRQALEPPRLRLLTQFNVLPEGFRFLVDLRALLLKLRQEDADLAALEQDLMTLLVTWFDVGFLELRRITWDSPASLLEKLIAYEAVHAIRSWNDLKNRLGSDRRVFAFFHPRMPDEPLIFVQVALVNGISDNVHALLDERAPVLDPAEADTAIFYSITNTQAGLAGISFGDFLIKRVVDLLATEFSNLNKFATLSPIPGFRAWLDARLAAAANKAQPDLLLPSERKALSSLPLKAGDQDPITVVLAMPDWHQHRDYPGVLKGPLMRLCAQYLVQEKRPKGGAYDRVAHFHLSNGARVERINWLANVSPEGLAQSAGMMVNYRYKLEDIESNHEAYRGEGKVRASSAVRSLLRV